MTHLNSSILICLALCLLVSLSGCRKPPETSDSANGQPSEASIENPSRPLTDEAFIRQHNQAIGWMNQFKYPEAYQRFSELLEQHPENDDLAVNTAIARLNMAGDSDLDLALEILEKVLARNPNHLRANYCAGLINSYLGPPADPTSYFKIAASQAPKDADAAYLLAKSLEQEEQLDEAAVEFQRSLDLNPYYASSLLGLARIARMQGDTAQAGELIARFEEMKANPNGRVFEFAYKRMGRLGEAQPVIVSDLPPPQIPAGRLFDDPVVFTEFEFSEDLQQHAGPVSMAVADLDHDGKLDLVLVFDSRLHCILDFGHSNHLADVKQFPWLLTENVTAVAFGDVDQNGELDIYLARRGVNQLWLQTDGQWEQSTDTVVGGGKFHTLAVRLFDNDHDGDLDIVCANLDGPLQVINNNRDGSFQLLDLDKSVAKETIGLDQIVLGDFDNRRDTDILLTSNDQRPAILWNERLWNYRLGELPEEMTAPGIKGVICSDLEHNGTLDLVIRRESSINTWNWSPSNQWQSGFELTLPDIDEGIDTFAVIDLNGDGALQGLFDDGQQFYWMQLDNPEKNGSLPVPQGRTKGWTLAPMVKGKGYSLIFLNDQGELFAAHPGTGRFPFTAVQFAGAENSAESMRSNFSGIGTRWKAQIGQRWTTGQAFPTISGPSQSLMPTVIGLQGESQIDFIAVDWTDGVFQAELAIEPGGVVEINETQRQLASCPVVYAFNGEQIEFVTDILGVGGIGFMTAPGEYAASRPWENLMLSPQQLQPLADQLIIKVGEPMEEACYLKSAKLVSVHLPADWNYVVDERMGTSAPFPTGEIYFYKNEFQPQQASSSHDPDVLPQLRDNDGKAPDVGPLDHRFIGLLEDEFILEFSFDEIPRTPGSQLALLIDGWVEYPYSQVVFAAWQAGRSYHPPSLEVSRNGTDWELAWEHFGFPAGMPRRMLLPLSKEIEEIASSRHFRIRSELQIYWDRISLVELEPCPQAVIVEHPLNRAEVRRVGFPQRSTGDQFRPHYDYSTRLGTWDSRHLPGFYTRLGDVTALFQPSESKNPLVIFGPGEEVHFEFKDTPLSSSDSYSSGNASQSAGSSKVPEESLVLNGYVFKLEGWCKDLDLYTQGGDILGPIPESAGVDSKLELKYNSRYESGPWYSYPAE